MDALELQKAKEVLEFSDEKLAADLGLPPATVRAWSQGEDRVPRHIARDLRWRVAVRQQHQALDASGLPTCDWVTALEAQPVPAKLAARSKQLEALQAHVSECPTCKARDAWVASHCPPLPERPLPLWLKLLARLAQFAESLPPWASPAVYWAAFFGVYSLFRVVSWLPRIRSHPREGLTALIGLAASISIGALLGLLYGSTKYLWQKRKARRLA
jgi:hypothetical protein